MDAPHVETVEIPFEGLIKAGPKRGLKYKATSYLEVYTDAEGKILQILRPADKPIYPTYTELSRALTTKYKRRIVISGFRRANGIPDRVATYKVY